MIMDVSVSFAAPVSMGFADVGTSVYKFTGNQFRNTLANVVITNIRAEQCIGEVGLQGKYPNSGGICLASEATWL